MKHKLLLLFFSIISFSAFSQVWIDSGAVWHFGYSAGSSGGFYKHEYTHDTIIEDKTCQVITNTDYRFGFNSSNELVLNGIYPRQSNYTYVSGDTVFYWNHTENRFFTLFNFGAQIGDTWVVATEKANLLDPLWDIANDTSRIEVIDKGTLILNEMEYRYLDIKPTYGSTIGMEGRYVERFGNINSQYKSFQYPFPNPYEFVELEDFIVEWFVYKLICFEDYTFPVYNTTEKDCEDLLSRVNIDEKKLLNIAFYPNPTTGLMTINNPKSNDFTMDIYDIQGKLLANFSIPSLSKMEIDISSYQKGLYIAKLHGASVQGRTIKIVKQ